MPKCNLVKNPNGDKDKTFVKAIKCGLVDNGITMTAFIKRTGLKTSTVYNDMKVPEKAPLYRIRIYYDALHIPSDKRGGII